jgi:glycosyltransferase involved in cell wall biosynthesis
VTPEITAILTTRNRSQLLERVLLALSQQTLAREYFEIVVVDDGSTDETQNIIGDIIPRLGLRALRQNHAGLAAAKNLGICAASGHIVVFLDDDDVADRGLLAAHLEMHRRNPDPWVAALGCTALDPSISELPVMRHVTRVGCQLFSYGRMRDGQRLSPWEFWGGRVSCKRAYLLEHGLFDPIFRFGCEDMELGWRLKPHGLKVLYTRAAEAVMIRSFSFDQFCMRSYRQGMAQFTFAELHRDQEVRTYCEIDVALERWERDRVDFRSTLQRVRDLDRLATAWTCARISVPDRFQTALDEAYRNAFFLCRAKGISDAAAAAGKANALGACEAAKFMLEYGLGRKGSAKVRRSAATTWELS